MAMALIILTILGLFILTYFVVRIRNWPKWSLLILGITPLAIIEAYSRKTLYQCWSTARGFRIRKTSGMS
jgi:hypothetical protein